MDKIGGIGDVNNGIVHRGPRNGEVVGIDEALVVFKGEVLDPIWSIGEGMIRWSSRVAERVTEWMILVRLSTGRIEARIRVRVTTTQLSVGTWSVQRHRNAQ